MREHRDCRSGWPCGRYRQAGAGGWSALDFGDPLINVPGPLGRPGVCEPVEDATRPRGASAGTDSIAHNVYKPRLILCIPVMDAFDILGDPVRRRILELLAADERSAGDVVDVIRAESD